MRTYSLAWLVGLSSAAWAVDVDPFGTSASMPHKSGTPATETPALTRGGLSGGLGAALSRDLVRYRREDGTLVSLAPEALSTTLMGAWTFEDRARVELIAPLYTRARTGTASDSFSGFALGDILLQGNIRLYENDSGSFSASVVPTLGIPTGRPAAYVARGPHMRVRGAVGGELFERVGYAGNLGFTLARGFIYEDMAVGSSVEGAVGAWVHVDKHTRLGADYEHRIGTSNAPGNRNNLAMTNLFAQAMTDSGLGLYLGVGKGVIQGVGTPNWRVQAAVTFARRTKDSDRDGIPDRDDLCPLDAEDFDGFEDEDGCPDLDNDGDTILDVDDACPNDPEDFDGFEDLDGCPDGDNDADGIPDQADACPNEPGLPEQDGCPDSDGDGLTDALDQCPLDAGPLALFGCPDRDGDGVPDFRDACPDEPRSEEEPVETSHGCPSKAFVEGDQIRITDKVMFDTGKATISTESHALLNEVASTLRAYPQIVKVEVAGHTDNVGGAASNRSLSERRAAAVKDYLLRQGIDAARLTSKGYGLDEPIDTNMTERGRERNRRVEFRILEQEAFDDDADGRIEGDLGGLTVKLPSDRPFTRVEIDGQVISPRAPFKGYVLPPGFHDVRVVDEARGLDFRQTIEVSAGETVILRVPEDAITRPDAPLPAGPVPEGSPMAVPRSGPATLPTTRLETPPVPPADAPEEPDGQNSAPGTEESPNDSTAPNDEAVPSDEAASSTEAAGVLPPLDPKEAKRAAKAAAKAAKAAEREAKKAAQVEPPSPAPPAPDDAPPGDTTEPATPIDDDPPPATPWGAPQ